MWILFNINALVYALAHDTLAAFPGLTAPPSRGPLALAFDQQYSSPSLHLRQRACSGPADAMEPNPNRHHEIHVQPSARAQRQT